VLAIVGLLLLIAPFARGYERRRRWRREVGAGLRVSNGEGRAETIDVTSPLELTAGMDSREGETHRAPTAQEVELSTALEAELGVPVSRVRFTSFDAGVQFESTAG
jgi:hypothetical protein